MGGIPHTRQCHTDDMPPSVAEGDESPSTRWAAAQHLTTVRPGPSPQGPIRCIVSGMKRAPSDNEVNDMLRLGRATTQAIEIRGYKPPNHRHPLNRFQSGSKPPSPRARNWYSNSPLHLLGTICLHLASSCADLPSSGPEEVRTPQSTAERIILARAGLRVVR